MSGLYAILSRAGAPPDESVATRLMAAMHHRGSQPGSTWIDDRVALGHIARPTTGEAERELLPLQSRASGAVMVWDGRLDNRREVGGRLDLPSAERDAFTDADLVLAAYDRFGSDFLHELIGDWAVVVWDRRLRRLTCAKDPVGWRQLHYTVTPDQVVVASEIQQLIAAGVARNTIDSEHLWRHLADHVAAPGATGYADIKSLAGGHAVKATSSGSEVAITAWWTLPYTPAGKRSVSDYQEEFNHLLDRAVEARTRTNKPKIALYLSGGIDSSALAGPVAAQSDTVALTAYSSAHPNLDERPQASAVARQLGLELVEVDIADCWALSSKWLPPVTFDQCVVPPQGPLQMRLALAAKDAGASVVIDGNGGDEFLDGDPRFLADAVLRMQPGHAWTLARRQRSRRHAIRAMSSSLYRATMPYRLQDAVNRRRGLHSAAQSCPRGGGGGVPVAEHARFLLLPRPVRQRVDLAARLDLAGPYVRWYDRHASQAAGIEQRSPLMDIRLIEFALTVPDWVKRHTGQPRALLRSAGNRWLDKATMDRRDKVYFNPLIRDGLLHEGARVEEALATLSARPDIDRTCLDQLRTDALDEYGHETVPDLWRATTAGLWLRYASLTEP